MDLPLSINNIGSVRVLTMQRSDKHNALNTQLTQCLVDALHEANRDAQVAVIVIEGAGRSFCAGADMGEFKGGLFNADFLNHRGELYKDLLIALDQMSKPTIAAAQGVALGMGAGVAQLCDFLVMGQSAKIGYPEVPHGMVPSLLIPVVQQINQKSVVNDMLLLGTIYPAEKACTLGIASQVVPDSELHDAALKLATRLAEFDSKVIIQTKGLMKTMDDLNLVGAIQLGRQISRERTKLFALEKPIN